MLQWAIRMDAMLPLFGEWVLSGPLLYALVIGLGFNWRLGPHVSAWTREIGAQPLDVLRQILRDLPDDGRHLPKLGVRARFIWGRYDLIAVRPVDFDDTHVHINANHAAPVLVAPEVASLTINFLTK
jgi:hypothetical protein